jgi:hypothetical protein
LLDGALEFVVEGDADHVLRQRLPALQCGDRHAHVQQRRPAEQRLAVLEQEAQGQVAGSDHQLRRLPTVLADQVSARGVLVRLATQARHVQVLVEHQHRPIEGVADGLAQAAVALDVGRQLLA